MLPPRSVILDFGGTLWPEPPPRFPTTDEYLDRLARAVPDTSDASLGRLLDALMAEVSAMRSRLNQDVPVAISRSLEEAGIAVDTSLIDAVRLAMLLDPEQLGGPVDGAERLLRFLREANVAVAIASNSFWCTGNDYRADLARWSLSHYVDAIVTSVDVGHRKPDPRVFQAALEQLGGRAHETVVIGDSETNDIEPAASLGLRTILVASVEYSHVSSANALVRSLSEATETLSRWLAASCGDVIE